jgi:hypothetical protein
VGCNPLRRINKRWSEESEAIGLIVGPIGRLILAIRAIGQKILKHENYLRDY